MATCSIWSQLPWDLAQAIIQRLHFVDQMSFAAVCSHWRGATADHRRRASPAQQPPWLLLLQKNYCPHSCNYLCIPADRNPHCRRLLPLRLPSKYQQWRIVGSSHGWLFMLEGQKAVLLNPLTGATVNLPDIPFSGAAKKAIISCPPTSGSCFAAVLYYTHRPNTFRYIGGLKIGNAYWVTSLIENHLIDMAFMDDGSLKLFRADGAVFNFRIVNEGDDKLVDPIAIDGRNPFKDGEVPVDNLFFEENVPMHLWRNLFQTKERKALMAVSMRTLYKTPKEWTRPKIWKIDGDRTIHFTGKDSLGFLLLGEMGFAEHLDSLDDDISNLWKDSVHDFKWIRGCGVWTVFSMADGKLLSNTEIKIPTKFSCSCCGHMAATWFLPDFDDGSYLQGNNLSDNFEGVLEIPY